MRPTKNDIGLLIVTRLSKHKLSGPSKPTVGVQTEGTHDHFISSSIWIRFLCVPPCSVFRVPHFFPIFLLPLGMPIDSEMMDTFWHSRCLNDRIDLFYMIRSFASGGNISLVAENGTKWIFPLLSIKSSPVDRFQSLRCLNNCINIPYMMGSLASGATNSLVAKIGTKYLATSCSVKRIWNNRRILMLRVSKWLYQSPLHDGITCKWCH